mgnify:CR=1 FL=1
MTDIEILLDHWIIHRADGTIVLNGKQDQLKKDIELIIAKRQIEIAKKYCDRLIGLSDGKIVFDGHPSSLTKELAEQLYDLENE